MVSFNSTIFFTIASFCYILLLFIAFFGKERVKSRDNKIYSYLIVITLIEVVAELLLCVFAGHSTNLFYDKLNKFYLLCLLSWAFMFLFYVLNSSDNFSIQKKYDKVKRGLFSVYLVFAVVIILAKTNYFMRNGVVLYSYGSSINILYAGVGLCIFIMFMVLIFNYKNIKSKKYIPIYVFLGMGTVTTLIQNMYPFLLLTSAVETFITVLMYHTIENPDLKIIEEVRDAKIVADNANSEKSIFLYNMTQEIRDIVKNINNEASGIINSNDIESDKDKAREILGYTSRFTTMTNDILDTSNMDRDNIKVFNEKYDIKLLLKEIILRYRDKFISRNIDFRINIDNNLPHFLYGDVLNMKSVLMEIFDNSYKYTESGFVSLSVNTIIKYDVCRLIIDIEDSGIGMRAKKLEEVINNNSDKGIGNAKRIINLIGGTLIISSDYGKGTKVSVVIDQKMDMSNTESIVTSFEKKYINKRVLVVCDSEAGLKIADKIFSKIAIDYNSCESGKECLDLIRDKEKYDLIFMDGEMDYMSGAEVMKKLRNIKGFDTKVILVTNNSCEYNDDYLKDGFTDYIVKPLSKEKVNNIINKYL